MAKINERSVGMTEDLRFRCTPADRASIEEGARRLGLNKSAFLRMALIKSGVIQA